nr:response regulator [Azospirillaceae bacterium]
MSDSFGKTGGGASSADPYRVMVVDDSAVIRGLLTRAIEGDPDIRVVASVGDGQMAINALQRNSVDVILLDIEMPVMDGVTAIPKLLAVAPQVKIIMASTLTARGADISLRCLQAGASDYIPKPSSTRELGGADDFKRELVSKVKALGAAARRAGSRSR